MRTASPWTYSRNGAGLWPGGFYQAEGGIAVRILSRRQEELDAPFLARRVETALKLRERLFPGEHTYRWVFGESDELPGLVADRYGSVVNVQSSCAFYSGHAEALAQAFLQYEGVEGVRLQVRGAEQCFGCATSPVECLFDGLRVSVDIEHGQKTGLFLDQRVNIRLMDTLAPGARVLDCHCHAGMWSCRAAQAGAESVLGVDTSQPAIEAASKHAALNGVEARCRFECADAAAVLARGEQYDIVLVDPPALAKSRTQRTRAMGLHQALHEAAMRAVAPGGYLVASCCSHFISSEDFLETLKRAARTAQREAQMLGLYGAAPDHPVLLAMPETAYLACAVLRLF